MTRVSTWSLPLLMMTQMSGCLCMKEWCEHNVNSPWLLTPALLHTSGTVDSGWWWSGADQRDTLLWRADDSSAACSQWRACAINDLIDWFGDWLQLNDCVSNCINLLFYYVIICTHHTTIMKSQHSHNSVFYSIYSSIVCVCSLLSISLAPS